MTTKILIGQVENLKQIKNLVNEALITLELQEEKIDTEIFIRAKSSLEKIKDLTI